MEPFLGNANERQGKNERRLKTQAVQAGKEMFVLRIAVPKFAQFCWREKEGRKQLTLNLFLWFFLFKKQLKKEA